MPNPEPKHQPIMLFMCVPEIPCVFVIFGATGDLTKRLLIPSLYNLLANKLLPDKFAIIGVSNVKMTSENFARNSATRSVNSRRPRSVPNYGSGSTSASPTCRASLRILPRTCDSNRSSSKPTNCTARRETRSSIPRCRRVFRRDREATSRRGTWPGTRGSLAKSDHRKAVRP